MTKAIQQKCGGKICHMDKTTAYIARSKQQKKHGVKLYVYNCPICWYWHLTSKPVTKIEGIE